ncbi:uncharacterized protein LOC144582739 [Callithrix jacchus]
MLGQAEKEVKNAQDTLSSTLQSPCQRLPRLQPLSSLALGLPGGLRSQAGTDPEAGTWSDLRLCRNPLSLPLHDARPRAHSGSIRRWTRAARKLSFLSAPRPPEAAGPKEGHRVSSPYRLGCTNIFPTLLADAPTASNWDGRAPAVHRRRLLDQNPGAEARGRCRAKKQRDRRRSLRPSPTFSRVCGQSGCS